MIRYNSFDAITVWHVVRVALRDARFAAIELFCGASVYRRAGVRWNPSVVAEMSIGNTVEDAGEDGAIVQIVEELAC